MSQSEAFKKATVDSKKLTSKPNNEDLLELYGTASAAAPMPHSLTLPQLCTRSPLVKISPAALRRACLT